MFLELLYIFRYSRDIINVQIGAEFEHVWQLLNPLRVFLHSLSKSTKRAAVSLPVISLSDEMFSMSSLNSTFLSTNFFCESGLRRPCYCLTFSGCSKSSEYTFRTVWGIFSYFRAVITCSKSTTCKWGYYNIRTTHKRVHIAVSLLIEKVIELPLFLKAL